MTEYIFFVYILKCRDGSYYTGVASCVEQRVFEHNQGAGCRYTAERRPVELVWADSFGTRGEALEAERKIKGWSRKKKEALMRGDWEMLKKSAKKDFKKKENKKHQRQI